MLAPIIVAIIDMMRKKRRSIHHRRGRSKWMRDAVREREFLGEYHRLIQELRLDDGRFYRYFRMSTTQFDGILSYVGPRIKRQDTNYRRAIIPAERLAICLR